MLCFFNDNCRKWKSSQISWLKHVERAKELERQCLGGVHMAHVFSANPFGEREEHGSGQPALSIKVLPASQKLQTVTSWMFSQDGIATVWTRPSHRERHYLICLFSLLPTAWRWSRCHRDASSWPRPGPCLYHPQPGMSYLKDAQERCRVPLVMFG